jgi:tetratricopeptide (TPR) repeat protein
MGRADEAHEVIAQAIAAFRAVGDRAGLASCLSLQGVSAYNRGDFAAGREFYTQALSAYKALGDELATANVLGNLAELEFADGRPERALGSVNESLEIVALGKYATDLAILHNNMTAYRIAIGDLDAARDSARKALHWALPEQNAWNTAVSLQHLALLGALRGQVAVSARLLGYVNAQYGLLVLAREATEKWAYEKLVETLQERLSAPEMDALVAQGAQWSEDTATEEALSI